MNKEECSYLFQTFHPDDFKNGKASMLLVKYMEFLEREFSLNFEKSDEWPGRYYLSNYYHAGVVEESVIDRFQKFSMIEYEHFDYAFLDLRNYHDAIGVAIFESFMKVILKSTSSFFDRPALADEQHAKLKEHIGYMENGFKKVGIYQDFPKVIYGGFEYPRYLPVLDSNLRVLMKERFQFFEKLLGSKIKKTKRKLKPRETRWIVEFENKSRITWVFYHIQDGDSVDKLIYCKSFFNKFLKMGKLILVDLTLDDEEKFTKQILCIKGKI